MKPPILVNEQGNIMVFESLENAELYLEPIDVQNNEYVAYDSEGRLLQLIATPLRVTIKTSESEPQHSSELHELLTEFLIRTGVPENELLDDSLQELISKSLKYKIK